MKMSPNDFQTTKSTQNKIFRQGINIGTITATLKLSSVPATDDQRERIAACVVDHIQIATQKQCELLAVIASSVNREETVCEFSRGEDPIDYFLMIKLNYSLEFYVSTSELRTASNVIFRKVIGHITGHLEDLSLDGLKRSIRNTYHSPYRRREWDKTGEDPVANLQELFEGCKLAHTIIKELSEAEPIGVSTDHGNVYSLQKRRKA